MGLDARLANPVMKAGSKQQNYLRVALNGCEPKRSDNRNPVNVAKYLWKLLKLKGPAGFASEIAKKGAFAAKSYLPRK